MNKRDVKELEKTFGITIKEAKVILESGKGIYGHKYHNAGNFMCRLHWNDPIPREFQKSGFIKSGGMECEVLYNYVRPYGLGSIPHNTWMGFAEIEYRGENFIWQQHLNEMITTFKEACKELQSIFDVVVRRMKKQVRTE